LHEASTIVCTVAAAIESSDVIRGSFQTFAMRSAFTATLTVLEQERDRKKKKDKEMGREDVKAIKDLMILDFVMHIRLPEQGKLVKDI